MASSDHYDYELPRDQIAQRPAANRADARLLVVDRAAGSWQHAHVRDLADFLEPPDILVLNDTRVIPARLVGYRTRTGGRWSGLFVSANEQGHWQVMGKTRGKITAGETVTLQDSDTVDRERLEMVAPLGDGLWVAKPESRDPYLDILQRVGRIPLPPYIRDGEMSDRDVADYQTVFATKPGAIAAPTAGLHFTADLLAKLASRGIASCRVTLHVGVGTFRPLAVDDINAHAMHAEWAKLDEETAERLRQTKSRGGRAVAVGTTVVRTLETAARQGADSVEGLPSEQASLQPWVGDTNLYIRPPFDFRAVDALLTNFHLPKTTLLVLVRTFGGDELIRAAYEEAIREGYRFYSYGDAMLIL